MGGACMKNKDAAQPAPSEGARSPEAAPAAAKTAPPPADGETHASRNDTGVCNGMKNATILHFNDVYNIERSARFVQRIKEVRAEEREKGRHVFTLFSGDAFSPSIMSTIMRGKQMVPVLNALDIDVACLGNHDLDFGLEDFRALKDECNFPWLCSNAKFSPTGEQLGGCKEYAIIASEGGPRLLVFGLIEPAWIATLASLEADEVDYEDFCKYLHRRVPELIAQHGAFDAVIAMSHMRMPNDEALAEGCGGADSPIIDMVLGGHDHHYEDLLINSTRILNSGCDFQTFTNVQIDGRGDSGEETTKALNTTTIRVDVGKETAEHEETAALVNELRATVEKSMDNPVGFSRVALDARFSEIRTRETNISNFIATLMCRATDADVAILNSGTIRADKIVPKGTITVRDCCELLPMADELSVIELTGDQVLAALENGISQYPAMEGRFPCVDGVRFEYDPAQPAGSRISRDRVYIRDRPVAAKTGKDATPPPQPIVSDVNDEENSTVPQDYVNGTTDPLTGFSPIDYNRTYRVVSKTYLLQGKDGYDVFVNAPIVRTPEDCPVLPTCLRNVFTELGVLRRWAGLTLPGVLPAAAMFNRNAGRCSVVDPFAIAPTVDGRIKNVAEEPVLPFTTE